MLDWPGMSFFAVSKSVCLVSSSEFDLVGLLYLCVGVYVCVCVRFMFDAVRLTPVHARDCVSH